MKNNLKKDLKRRKEFKNNELDALILKAIAYNEVLPLSKRKEAAKMLDKNFSKDSRITRVRNRCLLTGRSRGVITKYKISRIAFKNLAYNGLIPGIRKSSW